MSLQTRFSKVRSKKVSSRVLFSIRTHQLCQNVGRGCLKSINGEVCGICTGEGWAFLEGVRGGGNFFFIRERRSIATRVIRKSRSLFSFSLIFPRYS